MNNFGNPDILFKMARAAIERRRKFGKALFQHETKSKPEDWLVKIKDSGFDIETITHYPKNGLGMSLIVIAKKSRC